ncbi:MAG: GntR family transcriptional regulator [Actinomycetota bacterium]|nr:GntR family transcriptional regulator [Actinomycetota bacterium]
MSTVIDDTADAPTPNRSSEVYEALRQAIVEGEYRPNQRLVESELAERLEVSRTPVRESMQRLAADGLVLTRRRGWIVREHSIQEIRDIFEVRAALEGYAARLASTRATAEMLEHIEQIHLHYAERLSTTPRTSLLRENDDFHDAVVVASGNARLAEQIKRNSQFYFVHRMAGFLSDEEVRILVAGHQALVDALLTRDPERAERVAREGVMTGLERTLLHVH